MDYVFGSPVPRSAMTDEPSTVADRVAEHAVTVETDPEASLEDLDPLRTAFEDHTVVGLDEATHGTREFFELKHRLIAFLVRELDCRVVAMEAAFSESTAIHDYVVHGEGDPKEALDGIHFWTWNVESVLSLLEWLRAFNEGRPLDDRVRFYGVDAQHTVGPARELREYLDRVDPDYLARVEDDLDTLAEGLETWTTPDEEVLATTAATADTVAGVRDRLAERRESYVEATSPEEHELAVRHAWTLGRAHELAAENAAADGMSGWAVRERSMAANLAWALDREDADQVVLWAHNAHLMRGTRDLDGTQQRGLGQLLAAEYGDDYYPLGFDFDRGEFQAIVGEEFETEGLQAWVVDSLSDGEAPVADAFANVDAPAAVLDFETAREDPRLAGWLDREHERRDFGAVFRDERQTAVDVPAERFDGLAVVYETTRAVPIDDEDDESEDDESEDEAED